VTLLQSFGNQSFLGLRSSDSLSPGFNMTGFQP
jgi:hypothetical protein